MPRTIFLAIMSLVVVVACRSTTDEPSAPESEAHSTDVPLEKIHLPRGDYQRGLRAFQDLHCTACHQIAGYDFPDQRLALHPPVVLGETEHRKPTPGQFVTALIAPGHELAPSFPAENFGLEAGESVMADYTAVLSVQDLLDLVEFLRGTYP